MIAAIIRRWLTPWQKAVLATALGVPTQAVNKVRSHKATATINGLLASISEEDRKRVKAKLEGVGA